MVARIKLVRTDLLQLKWGLDKFTQTLQREQWPLGIVRAIGS